MTKVLLKYCGLTSFADLLITANRRADYLGFNFYKGSKRYVEPEIVADWIERCPVNIKGRLVGVFVNATLEDIEKVLKVIPLQVIQCHGTESPEFIKACKHYFKCDIWKAIRVTDTWKEELMSFVPYIDAVLLDANVNGQYGGTGKAFGWDILPDFKRSTKSFGLTGWIAGGINVSNVDSLLAYQPQAIDIASGIESNNEKSVSLIKEIERKVINYENSSR